MWFVYIRALKKKKANPPSKTFQVDSMKNFHLAVYVNVRTTFPTADLQKPTYPPISVHAELWVRRIEVNGNKVWYLIYISHVSISYFSVEGKKYEGICRMALTTKAIDGKADRKIGLVSRSVRVYAVVFLCELA